MLVGDGGHAGTWATAVARAGDVEECHSWAPEIDKVPLLGPSLVSRSRFGQGRGQQKEGLPTSPSKREPGPSGLGS